MDRQFRFILIHCVDANLCNAVFFVYISILVDFSRFHPRDSSAAVMQSGLSRRPGCLKPPEVPISLDHSASHRDEVRVVLDMLDEITATTKDVIREARFFQTDANICEETYRDQCSFYLIGKRHRLTYAGQSIRAIGTSLGRHHATRCIHHSVIQSLPRNIQIVSGFL